MNEVKLPWSLSPDNVSDLIQSNLSKGLSDKQAEERIATLGSNELRAVAKVSPFIKFIDQFKSPVVLILIAASVISGALGEFTDAVAILIIVIINAIIGFMQEYKAEAAIEALKKMSSPKTRVIRNGEERLISASLVCPGDVIVFESGDLIPADARLITSNQLTLDESILTGESLPVSKHSNTISGDVTLAERRNTVFSGTSVATGSGRAIVTATGMLSEIGKIADLLDSAKGTQTPLQERLESISKKLLVLCGVVVVIVGLLEFFRGEKLFDVLLTSISLAVAAIPEGLPAVVTVALALAVRRMSKKNAIVRHLPAVETLGSTSVICTDKTGTLTTGKMRVRESYPFSSENDVLIKSGSLCTNASVGDNGESTGDPTEAAILFYAKDAGINLKSLFDSNPRIYEWSFDGKRKRMSVAVKEPEGTRIHCKGAVEGILERCLLSPDEKKRVLEQVQDLSSRGNRLLGFASRLIKDFDSDYFQDNDSVEKDLTFLGLFAISDPPRKETIPAIKACKDAGIKVVMITGDHPVTAKAIATELGIVEEGKFSDVITGNELDALSPEDLSDKVENTAVYARVTPEHKLKIVKAWQTKGHVVAMTGDGVNDAPALKQASIGVAMGLGGTEVAKQASSMILTDDNFATIVSAVQEGRAVFGNIRRTIQYLLSGNLAEILIMFGAALLGWPDPLAPIHLLWINLVTDGFPSLALAAEPVPKDILKHQAASSRTFLDRNFYREMLLVGCISGLMALTLYGYMLRTSDELTARTYVFSFLVFVELFRSFASRSEHKTFFELGLTSNVLHLIAVGLPITFQILLHHTGYFLDVFKVTHIDWTTCFSMLTLTLIPVTFIESRKIFRRRKSI